MTFMLTSASRNAVKSVVETEAAPAALGPYSQAIKAGPTLYISGQLGLDPKSMDFAGTDVQTQAQQVMANLEVILKEAGATFENVVKTTVLLADMDDFAAVNEVYGAHNLGYALLSMLSSACPDLRRRQTAMLHAKYQRHSRIMWVQARLLKA